MNKSKIYTFLFVLIILLSHYSNLFSQAVKASVNRDRIFIGEQIQLKLSVEKGKAGITWFKFPDSLNHLEVIKRGKIDTVLNGNYTNYSQTIIITSFDSGKWQFPPLSLAGIKQSTVPISIDILPVDVSKMVEYNDIKGIEAIKPENNWLITGIIAAVTLVSIAAIWWLLKRKKKAMISNIPLKGNISPLDWALAELSKLKEPQPFAAAEVKKYYSDLNNISRTFFNRQLQQNSLQQTTDEWMINLKSLQVNNEAKTSFFQFLRLADIVKFAKYLPPATENVTSVDAIKIMLQKVSLLPTNLHSNYQPK